MQNFLRRFHIGTILGIVVSLYLFVTLASVVKRNHDLQTQLDGLNSQIQKLKNEKDQLSYQISYYQTDAFKEKEARAKLGLAGPGESVVILPKSQTSAGDQSNEGTETKPKSHIAQWLDFLFGS